MSIPKQRRFSAEVDTVELAPTRVHEVLKRNILADGFDMVLDLDASRGSRLVDARDGSSYLDMFTFFASNALGMNHPSLSENEEFLQELLTAALNKPSNSDVYSEPMARFIDTFDRVLGDDKLPHRFFIEGGAAAVENALKVAFDYKSRRNESKGLDPALGTKVMHLRHAFHGRSGYTMSLTNTDPNKVARFPKFDWPRIDSPAAFDDVDIEAAEAASLQQARAAFEAYGDDIACFIAEPIMGEGGDRHLRAEFLLAMQELCHEHDALFILDEVQTGCGLTGSAWAYQQLGLSPDVVAFGKKLQVCGVMAGGILDRCEDNVFHVGSRINSTWGGNLTDMVRSRRILEVIEAEGLIQRAAEQGEVLLDMLTKLAADHPELSRVRGRGLMCAFTVESAELRDAILAEAHEAHVLVLGCGPDSVRFRPALTVSAEELAEGVEVIDRILNRLTSR